MYKGRFDYDRLLIQLMWTSIKISQRGGLLTQYKMDIKKMGVRNSIHTSHRLKNNRIVYVVSLNSYQRTTLILKQIVAIRGIQYRIPKENYKEITI